MARYGLRAGRALRDRRHAVGPGPLSAARTRTIPLTHGGHGVEAAMRAAATRAATRPEPAFYVTYLHADELLSEECLGRLRTNLGLLERVARELGVEPAYVTASRAAELLRGS